MERSGHIPGEILNEKYRIVEIIHTGEQSTVYLSEEMKTGNQRVIKAIWTGYVPNEGKELSKELLMKEVTILRTLRNEGIPRFKEHFSETDWEFLVMERIEGKTLRELQMGSGKPAEVRDCVFWAMAICDVLHYLHNRAQPIIFRDLNPSNIMLTDKGQIKLIDFALARFFDDTKIRDTYIMGTFGYAAPEQYGTGQTTPQSDIYAVGTTLYDLLTLEDVKQFVFNFPPIRKFNRNVPPWLEKIIARCLEKQPEKRFNSAFVLKRELEKGFKKMGFSFLTRV